MLWPNIWYLMFLWVFVADNNVATSMSGLESKTYMSLLAFLFNGNLIRKVFRFSKTFIIK